MPSYVRRHTKHGPTSFAGQKGAVPPGWSHPGALPDLSMVDSRAALAMDRNDALSTSPVSGAR